MKDVSFWLRPCFEGTLPTPHRLSLRLFHRLFRRLSNAIEEDHYLVQPDEADEIGPQHTN
jgi:hypothetical protein